MKQFTYERPREKLVAQGVRSLKMVELLQILIGSGSATVSSALTAQYVNKLIENNSPSGVTYEQLQVIPGVGHAKACVILAAIEVGGRVQHGSSMYSDTSE